MITEGEPFINLNERRLAAMKANQPGPGIKRMVAERELTSNMRGMIYALPDEVKVLLRQADSISDKIRTLRLLDRVLIEYQGKIVGLKWALPLRENWELGVITVFLSEDLTDLSA